ncbi:rhodanese domain protein [Aquipluma nitroreducens]|uniref:Rhodanese domain protein n=1 Tax=Aquipluma nitroreducens TaxID=2010828 RepID=A0A5K7SGQ2_9BACT|nr:rhodanese-like domain-containing protein [Aquipluma nitroreducens]BBE20802.1 rhodanese domain protein [Aquipluma nitroreducens]
MKTTDKPILQDFHIEGVKHINPSDALEAIKSGEAVMLDVREINEVKLESVPLDRVLNHPMSVIMDRLSYIAKDQNIIVACPGGVRSVKVANLLLMHGYPSVANLEGGLTMWKAKGLPFESNLSFGGCGCNSGTKLNTNDTPLKNSFTANDFKNLKRI